MSVTGVESAGLKLESLLDCMSPPQNELTHPRRCNEGYPDGLDRASNKEGELWGIIAGIDTSILRNAVAIAEAAVAAKSGILGSFLPREAAIQKLAPQLAAK
jgi:hypothetical protein